MVDSRMETGKIEEEIRTNCGARKKENYLKCIFKGKADSLKERLVAKSGVIWGGGVVVR